MLIMLIRPCQLAVLLALMGLFVHSAHAQSEKAPENLDRLSSLTTLNPSQISKIDAFVDYWSKRLNSNSSAEVKEARNVLIRPLVLIGGRPASLAFRSTVSKAILPALNETISNGETYQAINAIQVVSALGTPKAIDTLEDHLEPDLEKRSEIRLWAAIGLGRAFGFKEGLRSDTLKGSLRSLTRGAEVETDPLVLRREMESLDAAVRNPRPDNLGGKELREFAVDMEIDVLKKTIERIESGDVPPTMLYALQPSLVLIRNQYIDPQLQQSSRSGSGGRNEKLASYIGRKSAPEIARIYTIVISKNDDIRQDPQLILTTGLLLESSEATLKLVDKNLRSNESMPSATSVRELWDSGRIKDLEATRDQWKTVMAGSPYNN